MKSSTDADVVVSRSDFRRSSLLSNPKLVLDVIRTAANAELDVQRTGC
jgi:hypothetical protein